MERWAGHELTSETMRVLVGPLLWKCGRCGAWLERRYAKEREPCPFRQWEERRTDGPSDPR